MNHESFSRYFSRERSESHTLTARGRKKTKVIATIGPACEQEETLRAMYHAGMNVARLNMSHGDHADHQRRLDLVRRLSAELDRPVAILVDLQGPKIRLTTFADGRAEWKAGDQVVITTEDLPVGDAKRIGTTYEHLHVDVAIGGTILIDDGLLRLRVDAVEGRDVCCTVTVGGTVKSSKGINLPGVEVSSPSLTEKDKDDLAWALNNDVDYFALSFVRSVQDVRNLRRRIQESGRDVPIIAKIERPEAVENAEDIIAATEGIMVARGDLGIEISTERLPVVQKHLIARANAHGKLVITATQMLESMVASPIPTRAESSDVANAIFDGTDAVMLSGETAAGRYPVEAVQEMMRISIEAEISPYLMPRALDPSLAPCDRLALAMASAATQLADAIQAEAVMIFSHGCEQALLMTKQLKRGKTITMCYDDQTWRRLSLYWGTVPLHIDFRDNPADLLEDGIAEALRHGALDSGDRVVALLGFAHEAASTLRVVEV